MADTNDQGVKTVTTTTTSPDVQAPEEKVPATAKKSMVWSHDGKTINYEATAELLPIYDAKTELIGHMFMLSYVTDQEDKSDRPVTFCWNGGPGGASYMVNIGGMGPRRVVTIGQDHMGPQGTIEDNPYTLLPSSDLVFIDAFGTGYSHVAKTYDAKKVWGVDGDADAFTRGIIAWLKLHDRFNCPVYLYGESYGTMRNAVVYRMLGENGIGVTGVVEQSTILDYAPTLPGNDAYYLGMTPVYAATAQYFGKTGQGVDPLDFFMQAFEFVNDKLSRAIVLADKLDEAEMDELSQEMSDLIGLSPEFIKAHGLRIELDTFRKNLLADEGKTLGRYDTRYTTYAYQDVQGDNEFYAGEDPSYDAMNSPWMGSYFKLVQEVGFEGYSNYVGLSFTVNESWNWNHQAPGTMEAAQVPNVAYDMATALRRNPHSRILFFGGMHDAATPYWNVCHDMSKTFLPKELQERIEYHVHANGHMAYEDDKTLSEMAPELAAFYEKRHDK